MESILSNFGGVPNINLRNDDDTADRLSHRYTVVLFVLFAAVVSTAQFVGNPINCWVPAHFTGNHETYADSYCWIKNTYYLPFDDYIPKAHEHDKRQVIPYYQWVPLFLLAQALMFFLPCMLWRTMNTRCGIDLNNIVESGEKYHQAEEVEEGDKVLRYMTKQTHRYLMAQYETRKGCTISLKHIFSKCCLVCGRRYGNYLTSLYLMIKILYICNVIGQLFLMTMFLGSDYYLYGFDVISAVANGSDWTGSATFPRVTMCDFNVRRLGNVQRYTVQCVLPINLFNEKIYLFLWFWLVILAFISCISLLRWAIRCAIPKDQFRFVKKHLKLKDLPSEDHKALLKNFVTKYLKKDGVFIVRLVGLNTNAITVTEYLCSLWNHYLEQTKNGEIAVFEEPQEA